MRAPSQFPPPDAPGKVRVDRASLLAQIDASVTIAQAEAELRPLELTLGLDAPGTLAIGDFLAAGAPGARDPLLDPADHLVAGLEAKLADGSTLEVRPVPRRAVGPDLIALLVGARGRFGAITRAWVRVHPIGVKRPVTSPVRLDRSPPVSGGEERLLEAIARELSRG